MSQTTPEFPTLVVGRHVVQVWTDRSDAPQSMNLRIDVDHERHWLSEEPAWQELGLGVSDGALFVWSARHLLAFAADFKAEPEIVSTDDDIRLVFCCPQGWILVCETSLRLVVQGREVSRLELGDVLVAACWSTSVLHVATGTGSDVAVVISDGRLTISNKMR